MININDTNYYVGNITFDKEKVKHEPIVTESFPDGHANIGFIHKIHLTKNPNFAKKWKTKDGPITALTRFTVFQNYEVKISKKIIYQRIDGVMKNIYEKFLNLEKDSTKRWEKLVKYRLGEINFIPKSNFRIIDSSNNFRYEKLRKLDEKSNI